MRILLSWKRATAYSYPRAFSGIPLNGGSGGAGSGACGGGGGIFSLFRRSVLGLVGRGGAACVGSSEAVIGWIDGTSSTEAGRKVAGRGRPVDSGTDREL